MIYLLRHGETIWNVEQRLQGQGDSPLTAKGIAQASALGVLLSELIEHPGEFTVVASPLGRTWQTAVLVCQGLGVDWRGIRFDDRLKEHDFGAWEGMTLEEIETCFTSQWAAREADKWNFLVPGGESYARVAMRIGQWLDQQRTDARLIVVGHGLAGRVLRGLYAGLPPEETTILDEPQDSLHLLNGGAVQAFAAEMRQ